VWRDRYKRIPRSNSSSRIAGRERVRLSKVITSEEWSYLTDSPVSNCGFSA